LKQNKIIKKYPAVAATIKNSHIRTISVQYKFKQTDNTEYTSCHFEVSYLCAFMFKSL